MKIVMISLPFLSLFFLYSKKYNRNTHKKEKKMEKKITCESSIIYREINDGNFFWIIIIMPRMIIDIHY